MNNSHQQYTFSFDPADERAFRRILDRLDDDEYVTIKAIEQDAVDKHRRPVLTTVMEMEPEAASMFRFGMKELTIRRTRTDEELAEEKAIKEKNTVKITIVGDPDIFGNTSP